MMTSSVTSRRIFNNFRAETDRAQPDRFGPTRKGSDYIHSLKIILLIPCSWLCNLPCCTGVLIVSQVSFPRRVFLFIIIIIIIRFSTPVLLVHKTFPYYYKFDNKSHSWSVLIPACTYYACPFACLYTELKRISLFFPCYLLAVYVWSDSILTELLFDQLWIVVFSHTRLIW